MNFKILWKQHPTNLKISTGDREKNIPCSFAEFKNQCAIRVSQAMHNAGFSLAGFDGMTCKKAAPNDPKVKAHSDKVTHAIRAEELANWLAKPTTPFGIAKKYRGINKDANIQGKQGIVFIKDYWPVGNQTEANQTGDHIDLWNGTQLTGVYSSDGIRNDAKKAKEIWFWEIR